MIDPELSQRPYRMPPPTRGVDPKRMNWLWRLICELASVEDVEMVEALHAQLIAVDVRRVRSWTISDRELSFFPITLSELERNVRALIALRQSRGEEVEAAPSELDEAAAAVDAEHPEDAGDAGESAAISW
jgi:hypothetical protein